MSLEIIIRYLVLVFSLGTLPALVLLVKHFLEDKTEDNLIQNILVILFLNLTLTMLITIITNIQLLYFGYEVKDIVFLSNIRNLIKSVALCGISWSLLYIRRIK